LFAGVPLKKSLLAGASLGAIALATGSQAADLGARPVYRAPPLAPAPAPFSWTGFYVGANVGAAWARSSVSDDLATSTAIPWISGAKGAVGTVNADNTGVIGGFQAGYNWQFTSLVLGVEGDISFSSLDRTVAFTAGIGGGVGDTYRSRLDTLGTLRGRIGWAFDRVLVYGTGGAAFASLKDQYTDPPSVAGFTLSPSSSVTGWTAGGGIEYAFADHWTARAEYLHVGFPDRSLTIQVFGSPYGFIFKDSLDIARVGINYKF
jgi:outer membrane immunogenic protein